MNKKRADIKKELHELEADNLLRHFPRPSNLSANNRAKLHEFIMESTSTASHSNGRMHRWRWIGVAASIALFVGVWSVVSDSTANYNFEDITDIEAIDYLMEDEIEYSSIGEDVNVESLFASVESDDISEYMNVNIDQIDRADLEDYLSIE